MPELVSINGEIVEAENAKISVFDHCFLYGDGVFEGVKLINGGILFHAEHRERLYRSAAIVRIEMPSRFQFDAELFKVVKASGLKDGYLRVVISRGTGTLGINPNKCPSPTRVIMASTIKVFPAELYEKGLKMIVAKTQKLALKSFDCRAKSCNYLTNIMAAWEFLDAQAEEAIMLDQNGFVSEGTVDNIFAFHGKRLITPSLNTNCLEGITRKKIMELADGQGYTVEEGLFTAHDFKFADEVFLTGTGAGVIPVSNIETMQIGEGRIGPKTKALRAEYERRIPEFLTYPETN